MSKTSIKYRAAHRVIVEGKTYAQDEFLPDDIDAGTLEQLKLSHAVYEYELREQPESAPSRAGTEPEEESEAPTKRRTRKK